MMYRILFLTLAVCLVISCSPVSKRKLTKTFRSTEDVFQDHTGFVLYDPIGDKTIYKYNAARVFCPGLQYKNS